MIDSKIKSFFEKICPNGSFQFWAAGEKEDMLYDDDFHLEGTIDEHLTTLKEWAFISNFPVYFNPNKIEKDEKTKEIFVMAARVYYLTVSNLNDLKFFPLKPSLIVQQIGLYDVYWILKKEKKKDKEEDFFLEDDRRMLVPGLNKYVTWLVKDPDPSYTDLTFSEFKIMPGFESLESLKENRERLPLLNMRYLKRENFEWI